MNTPSPEPTIQSLFPSFTPEEYRRAEENIEVYLGLVIRVYRRISQDPQALAELRAALYSAPEDFPESTLTVWP
jgi:hypothetical protein